MNKVEVYIADYKLELKEQDTVALTKQINDIAEIQKRQADYTNRFVCKKTPNNMAIAEMLNVPGNTSTRPYKWASARIVSNGIPVTNYGIALLQETKMNLEFLLIAWHSLFASALNMPSISTSHLCLLKQLFIRECSQLVSLKNSSLI